MSSNRGQTTFFYVSQTNEEELKIKNGVCPRLLQTLMKRRWSSSPSVETPRLQGWASTSDRGSKQTSLVPGRIERHAAV